MTARRLAVVAGIDEYPHLRADQQLRGCVNDAELMAEVLMGTFGFPEDGITLLRNAEASRDGILAALERLVADAQPGDVVVVHFSGHGSQMTDREGDEADGLDETIVPADSGRGAWPNRDITDDEIYEVLTRLTAQTPLVTLIFDCCHSGSVTRDLAAARTRRIEPDLRPASQLPPSPVAAQLGQQGVGWPTRAAGPSGWLPPGRRYTLLAGCRDEELSFEHEPPGGPPHGALTWFLTRALVAVRPGATYREVFEAAALGVTGAYPSQHPQLEGAADREVFGVRDLRPIRFLPVIGRDGATVTLGGGAAQGIAVGSRWTVYAPGTREPEGSDRLGTLLVTGSGTVSATAALEDEVATGAVIVGGRAVQQGRDLSAPPMTVTVVDDPGQLVEASPLLLRVPAAEPADARVIIVGPRDSASDADAVPQLGALAAPTVAVTGRDGRLLLPTRPAAAADTPQRLRDDLETVARYRRVLALDNPSGSLAGALELVLLRRAADGRWQVAEPEVAGGEVVYEEGEEIGLRLTSRHSVALYPAVLDLGLAYAVAAVHPYAGQEALAPGATVEVGTRPGEEIRLSIPPAFPFGGDADDTDSGMETVKVLFTTEPAQYTVLLQEGVTRDFAPSPAAAAWGAVARSFRLRRATPAIPLPPGGAVVQAGGVELRATGLRGRVVALDPGAGGRTRSRDLSTDTMEGVLRSESLDVQVALELTEVAADAGTRAAEPPVIELRPPAPAAGEGQLLLVEDEASVLTWHFALPTRDLADTRRTYRIDRRVVVAPVGEPGTRGLVGAIGKKLIKVLVFPLVEPAIGEVADYFAGRWEAKKRPYRLRHCTPDDFATPVGAEVQPSDWDRLSGERTLLLVHGTFSRSHSGFGRLPRAVFEQLYRRYEGRVLALDHFTLSHTPRQNVEWLIERVPDGRSLDLDIVCHSRGGLVARTLVERQGELSLGSRRVTVNRVVFVATPNAGTALADGDHLGDLLDTYTNILNFLPDNGVTDVLEGVVTVAKMLAVGALKGLDGLAAMVPDGDYQRWLNRGPAPGETSYQALAADYEPTIPGFADFARDWVMDTVFARIGNDLVVPTDGVYSPNGAGGFPIDERHVFLAADGVTHTTFFSHPATQDRLLAWLGSG
jgi:Caspase domain